MPKAPRVIQAQVGDNPPKVLDPFAREGLTGVSALNLGQNYLGVDLNRDLLPTAAALLQGRKPPAMPADPSPDLIGELFGGVS